MHIDVGYPIHLGFKYSRFSSFCCTTLIMDNQKMINYEDPENLAKLEKEEADLHEMITSLSYRKVVTEAYKELDRLAECRLKVLKTLRDNLAALKKFPEDTQKIQNVLDKANVREERK